MLKRSMLFCVLALALAAPAQAEASKQLHLRGVVVSASAELIVVENFAGDVMFRCLVPERLAEKTASLRAGDRVRMLCHRKRGQRAVLLKLERLGERGDKRDHDADAGDDAGDHEQGDRDEGEKGEKRPEHAAKTERAGKPEHAASAVARGTVVELGTAAIVVQDAETGRRLACRVPEPKAHKLEGVNVGDRVKILCTNGQLAQLERGRAEQPKLVGTITALSSTSVTVTGDGRTLTCSVPARLAERVGLFTVGTSVKMMCRGAELAYLERA